MESNLVNRRRRLKGQIPDIKSSLIMIDHLREKSAAKEEIESHFLISDQAYSKAAIPPTDKVKTKILEFSPLQGVFFLFYHHLISRYMNINIISGMFMARSQCHA